jgi:Fe-Mn family superoxide dismutase
MRRERPVASRLPSPAPRIVNGETDIRDLPQKEFFMSAMTRREMLIATGAGAAALMLPKLQALAEDKPAGFTLPPLPYAFDALEPSIDAKTMEIHHDRHHKAYVDNLNKALAGSDWASKPLEEILRNYKEIPEKIRSAIVNNGGGHFNHSFFWLIMAPAAKSGKPSPELQKAIDDFGGMDKLKAEVLAKAVARFGSGWAWLTVGENKALTVISTPNQNTPIMTGAAPILGIDVWEHAYYLKYQNKRADYVNAWWNVANWEAINANYAKAMK